MKEEAKTEQPERDAPIWKHADKLFWLALVVVIILAVQSGVKNAPAPRAAPETQTGTADAMGTDAASREIAERLKRTNPNSETHAPAEGTPTNQDVEAELERARIAREIALESSQSNRYEPPVAKPDPKAEQEKRDWMARHASNVVAAYDLSVSPSTSGFSPSNEAKKPEVLQPSALTAQDFEQGMELLRRLDAPVSGVPTPETGAIVSRTAVGLRGVAGHPPSPGGAAPLQVNPADPYAVQQEADGPKYVLFEGTVIECTLLNRLESTLGGPVACLVSGDIWSHDRQHVLIPQGTKAIGEIERVNELGQARVGMPFHRLIMPDGFPQSLDKFRGLDQIGDAGLRDKVNNHYVKIFGASLAVGLIGAAAEGTSGSILTQGGWGRVQSGIGYGLDQAAARIMEQFLNILPTVTIREGARVKIWLANDLLLPDYRAHRMPENL
jgi:Bacterial conjugation TrbI-like protein